MWTTSSSLLPDNCIGISGKMFWASILLTMLILQGGHSAPDREYCQYDTFEASCKPDEVVLIQSARYGRMKIGDCVKNDFGFLGCYADVTRLMDRKCSGRRRCQVRVVDPTFENIHPCNEEFKNYLEAAHTCVKVLRSSEVLCSNLPPGQLPNSSFISIPDVTSGGVCGSPDAPYVLRVPHGQKVNLSLLDFHLPLAPDLQHLSQALRCDVYATIRETSSGRTVDVCGGQNRESIVFVSESNIVEIYLNSKILDGTVKFLLKYQIVGCPDVEAPIHAWVERDGSNAVIGCDESKQVWRLQCKSNTWIGTIGNCTKGEPMTDHSEVSSRIMSIPTGMLIAIVIGIACMISFSILLMGIYYLRRRRRRHQQMSQKPLRSHSDEYILSASNTSTYATSRDACSLLSHQRKSCPICVREKSCPSAIAQCGDYAYTWSDTSTAPRREKVYSAGVYAPLPCRCIPMNVRDLEQKENAQNDILQQPSIMIASMSESLRHTGAPSSGRDSIADGADDNVHTPFLDTNPDVIQQQDCASTYRTDEVHYQPIGGVSTFKRTNNQRDEVPLDS